MTHVMALTQLRQQHWHLKEDGDARSCTRQVPLPQAFSRSLKYFRSQRSCQARSLCGKAENSTIYEVAHHHNIVQSVLRVISRLTQCQHCKWSSICSTKCMTSRSPLCLVLVPAVYFLSTARESVPRRMRGSLKESLSHQVTMITLALPCTCFVRMNMGRQCRQHKPTPLFECFSHAA